MDFDDACSGEHGVPTTDGDVVAAALTAEPAPAAAGVQRLMRAVLVDAIQVYLGRWGSTDLRGRRELAEVQQWLRSPDRDWPFSFERVCEALGLEPDRVRTALRRARERAPVVSPGRAPAAARLADAPRIVVAREASAAALTCPVDTAEAPPVLSSTAC